MTAVAAKTQTPVLADASAQPRAFAWMDAGLGMLVGLGVFFAAGFNHILPPHKISWLMSFSKAEHYYDPTTFYLGWKFYRHAPWTWPLGLNHAYGMECASSIAFSDSLPAMAFLFKPFSRWMGADFQYIGIWILICFLLQGMFGALLASRFVKNVVPKILIAGFFATSPILFERAATEYTLMGHWLLLWGIYLYLTERTGRIRWVWMALVALGATTSFYMAPMVLALWIADAVKAIIRRPRKTPWLVIEGVILLATLLFVMWGTGYFLIQVKSGETTDFGKLATNLLGPIDPWRASLFVHTQAKSPFWVGEGYCYLGAGIIVLICLAAYEFVRAGISRRALVYIFPLAIVVLGLGAFSLSDKVALGSHVLELPPIWGGLGRMFRSSSRMFWPMYYGLFLASFYLVTRSLKPWRMVLVLGAALFVQLVDVSPSYLGIRERYTAHRSWKSPLKSPFWAGTVGRYHSVVVFPHDWVTFADPYQFAPIAYFCAEHDIQTNSAYLARIPIDHVRAVNDGREKALLTNTLDPDSLYILTEEPRFDGMIRLIGKEHGVGKIDGYYVIAPNWFAGGQAAGPGDLKPGGAR